MKTFSRGYTIVEILIIISVIGILAGIGIVSWGGYVNWSNDRARENDTRQWATTFDLYKSRFVVYPAMPVDNLNPTVICLSAVGSLPTGAANTTGGNKCGLYLTATTAGPTGTSGAYAWTANNIPTASPYAPFDFDTEIKRVGNIVKNSYEASGGSTVINNSLVGPIAYISQDANTGTINVTAYFINFFKGSTCPGGGDFSTATDTDFNSGQKFAKIAGLKPSAVSVKVCYITKTFQYTAS